MDQVDIHYTGVSKCTGNETKNSFSAYCWNNFEINKMIMTRGVQQQCKTERHIHDCDYNKSILLLTLRRLMSYIYGAPILDVSRSHTTTQHSR